MKRTHALILILASLVIAGVVFGQDAASNPFVVVEQIGAVRPQGIRYDPNYDQFVMVTPRGQLLLVDASSFAIKSTLYASGNYNAYRFSHDGNFLVLAIDSRVEVWNTQTGAIDVSIEPQANYVTGPLQFSDDDSLLMFTAIVPASQATRRSENDTDNLPWLWDLRAARDQADSRLPGRVEAYSFFDYRNGLFLEPNDKILAALPDRLQVLNVGVRALPVIDDISSPRFEQDPVDLWYSLQGDQMYVRPVNNTDLLQIHTGDGSYLDLPIGRELVYRDLHALNGLVLSKQSRMIGAPTSQESNSFLRMLLGDDYRSQWGDHPITVMLVDVLTPVTSTARQTGLLIYTFDEQTGRGSFDFVYPQDALAIALAPDGKHLAVRHASGDQPVEIYDMDSGILQESIIPALHDPSGNQTLAYNAAGDELIVGFERFKAADGSVVFQLFGYNTGYDSYYFSTDSQHLVTISGSEWWVWDINADDVIRRERFDLHGDLLDNSADGTRFLTALNTAQGVGREVLDMDKGERLTVYFEQSAEEAIADIVASPNWENYLVVYNADPNSPQYPNGMIALYNIRDGKRWEIIGTDLPSPDNRSYGWIDNETAYISGSRNGSSAPERIYGLDYDPSGLPACLVTAYPERWHDWVPLWERLTDRLTIPALGRLTQNLCAAPSGDDAALLFTPTPTATPVPLATAAPRVFAGVPPCLTQYFADQALDYAQEWRRLTTGLSADEIANLQDLLCEGLRNTNPYDPGVSNQIGGFDNSVEAMTIDMATGARSLVTLPQPTAEDAPALELVLDEFRRVFGFYPANPILSPDHQLMAVSTNSNQVLIYKLAKSYDTIIAEATATAVQQNTPANVIGVRPTATALPQNIGTARPTLTPTITPTSPPTPAVRVDQAQYGEVQEVCPATNLYSLANPAPDFSAAGRLLVYVPDSPVTWAVNVSTGHYAPDETLPRCGVNSDCNFSFDQDWMLIRDERIRVSRPDGSGATELFTAAEAPEFPNTIGWLDNHTVEYNYSGYLSDQSVNPVDLWRRFDVFTGEYSAPFQKSYDVRINDLPTEIISEQPFGGSLLVARTSFEMGETGETGSGVGNKYYIYDRATQNVDYFARLTSGEMTFVWHPMGKALYYQYPDNGDWFVYDPATHEHHVFGALPNGGWSRDGRYTVQTYFLDSNQAQDRRDAGQPIPSLQIWDSESGLARLYCTPPNSQSSNAFYWSPDNRYLAMVAPLPTNTDESFSISYATIYILDTQTGSVTELPVNASQIITWTEDAP